VCSDCITSVTATTPGTEKIVNETPFIYRLYTSYVSSISHSSIIIGFMTLENVKKSSGKVVLFVDRLARSFLDTLLDLYSNYISTLTHLSYKTGIFCQ
jgi:hypothetical protein